MTTVPLAGGKDCVVLPRREGRGPAAHDSPHTHPATRSLLPPQQAVSPPQLGGANFTQRGQERNIEVGVLVEDSGFSAFLAGQWLGLIEAGFAEEFAAL